MTVRIETKTGTMVPRTSVTLPTAPVAAPSATLPTQTCAGNSVVGAVDAVTSHNWDGTWSDTTGWSIDRIKTTTALAANGQKWLVLVGDVLVNGSPCDMSLNDGDSVTLYPACLTSSTTGCIPKGVLELFAPTIGGPGAPIDMTVWQIAVTVDSTGSGTSVRSPSLGAAVIGPDNSTFSDSTYGTGAASITIAGKGPAVIYAQSDGFASDSSNICITDGADGYCGTTAAPQQPFDPLKFCQTTGSDGYCGSPDKVAPVGHIGFPAQAQAFTSNARPTKLKGTVDFDPSLTDHVDLRLMRQNMVTVKIYKKRKVWVTRKVRGKKVRKRVVKRIPRKVKKAVCYGWSDSLGDFKSMKKCDPTTAPTFKADGAEVWSYDFLRALVPGSYTLDAIAVDGAGNPDSTMELGRNRVTFTVS